MNTDVLLISSPLAHSKPLGIDFDSEMSFEQWEEFGRKIGKGYKFMQFGLGDWLNYGRARFGHDKEVRDRLNTAISDTGIELNVLKRSANIARRISIDDRQLTLTFEAQAVISAIEDDKEKWLDEAIENRLSAKQIRSKLKGEKLAEPKYESITDYVTSIERLYLKRREKLSKPIVDQLMVQLKPIYDIISELADIAQKDGA